MDMHDGLHDIEVLASRCRSDQSKEHITESIRCYKAGAYRATIVTAWISVVFDLLDKIRELALSGDSVAKELESTYAAYITQINQDNQDGIKGALEFERRILEICRDRLQFFDSQQFVDLERLREDRHRCAHPSFQNVGIPYYPSSEQARLHVRNAVMHVLAMPPVQGKAALAGLKVLISSDYFPIDEKSAQVHLRSSSLGSGTDSLFKGVVESLIFGFVTVGDPLYHKLQVYAALNALIEIRPVLVMERIKKNLNVVIKNAPDPKFNSAAALVACVRGGWGALDETSRDKVTRFVSVAPVANILNQLENLFFIPQLKAAVIERVGRLSIEELVAGIAINLRHAAKDAAITMLSQAHNWDRVNEVFSKVLLPLFSLLTAEDVERIIRMPRETKADLIGANMYTHFIERVRKTERFDNAVLNEMLIKNHADYLAFGDLV
jgi:hypothetical protein